MNISSKFLVAIDDISEIGSLMGKVVRLAQCGEAPGSINAVRVIYEELADFKSERITQTADLQKFVLAGEATRLENELNKIDPTPCQIESTTIWNKSFWQGVLDTADQFGSNLIVKCAKQEKSLPLRTPDDWNILRHSHVPVLLSSSNAWSDSPVIVAAIDISDDQHAMLNRRVLSRAVQLCADLSGTLNIVSVFPLLSPWMEHVTTLEVHKDLTQIVRRDMLDHIGSLCNQMGINDYQPHILEGSTEIEIGTMVEKTNADLLVIGTKIRRGVAGAILGNSAEKILYHTQTDILTVP